MYARALPFNRGIDTMRVGSPAFRGVMPDAADLPSVVPEDERASFADRDPNTTWAASRDYYLPDAEPFCWIGEIE
jgi:hypothetical protein